MDIRYEIVISGHLPPQWAAAFDGMELYCRNNGQTAISGFLPDQSALYGLLLHLRDLGLTLISVNPVASDAKLGTQC